MIDLTTAARKIEKQPETTWRGAAVLAAPMLLCCGWFAPRAMAQQAPAPSLELVRAARPWEFASALGTRAGLLGDESGNFEAWVYPLKIARNLHLRFKIDGQTIEGKAIVRSVSVRPESTTITYVWDTFSICETLFVPVHEPGVLIGFEIDSAVPVEIEAVFERDFQLEWPGTMGASNIDWNAALHAFSMNEDQQKFSALIGSPSATSFHAELVTNYTATKENSFSLGASPAGKSTKLIVMAASFQGLPPADITYKRLSASYPQLLAESAAYYGNYLKDHVSLELPDKELQQAYEWGQVSVLQGLVTNPFLGTSLVAGYRASGDDQRPGYAWFFGRDALWTALAVDAEGDFATTRSALQFLGKYQRADGKVPHEIAQGASFVPWFQSMPYAYASADATPLFIVAMNDYVQRSGDITFAREQWDNLWRAYQFMISTYDKNGLPRNEGIGHGWVEGGPLLPVRSEIYQSGVALEALRSLASLAHSLGKEEQSLTLTADFERNKLLLNQAFWIADKGRYAFALDSKGRQVDTPSVLATVPMWFGLLDNDKAVSMLAQLDGPEIETDWGMRIIPTTSPKYEADGYHSGTVWPLFTGWASVGEYRYHESLPAYSNLRANALLTFGGSLGHVAEVLSGNYYQTLATGSPHQIWSSAMVVSPLLTGLFGLDANALTNHLSFSPHIPADWTSFAIRKVRVGKCELNFRYGKSIDRMTLEVERTAGDACTVDFSPSLSLRSQVTSVEWSGHDIPFHIQANTLDQHVSVHLTPTDKPQTLAIRLKNDFGLSEHFDLPSLGSTSQGLRIISQGWSENREALTLEVASASSGVYELGVWNPEQVSTVDGAELVRSDPRDAKLRITIQSSTAGAANRQTVVLHLDGPAHRRKDADNSDSTLKGTHNAN